MATLFAALALALPIKGAASPPGALQNAAAPRAASLAMKINSQGQMVLKRKGKAVSDVYLQSLGIQVDVTGNIASTRYRMVFKNNTESVLDGELTFPLPDGCSVTHYALDIDDRMREAVPVPVEKAKATQVFEEIEQRQEDPGLLEKVEGNNFRTRIYPIPANGERTVSIGYVEELPLENGQLHYRLPIVYQDTLEFFDVRAKVWSSEQKPIVPDSGEKIRFDKSWVNYVAELERKNYKPARPLIFALPVLADKPQVMMQPAKANYYFLASVTPQLESRKKRWGDKLAIIWDVSLSASQRNLQREMEMLDIIFAEKKKASVSLYFLNNRLKKGVSKGARNGIYKVANGNWGRLKAALSSAVFDGGTDFSQINLSDIAGNEILFFSDGISTLSAADFVKNTKDARPIHCVVSSSKADYSAMKLIAGKTRGKFININALSAAQLTAEILNETMQFLGAEHGGAVSEVYPSIAAPVRGNFSVAGISDTNGAEITLLFGFGGTVEKRIPVKLKTEEAGDPINVYKVWAQKKIAELDLDYEANRAELTAVGQQFGIVTRNTSLIVLETAEDYVRYDISPPQDLWWQQGDDYERMVRKRKEEMRDTERDMLASAAKAAKAIKKWRNTDFVKKIEYPAPKQLDNLAGSPAGRDGGGIIYARGFGSGVSTGCYTSIRRFGLEEKPPTIKIKPIRKDNDYLNKLTGKIADDYQTYLTLRDGYAHSPAFYFDMADWFYTHSDKETALRILTSIAELELEDASLYRLLGYRLKEYGEFALQLFVCQKAIRWRPMEPQSYRDYALALADNGEEQAALDSLYALLTKPFSASISGRSRGIEEVVVTEINRLIAKNAKLNTSKINKRLIINIPVDIRVVINWNNNTGIDLHVKDPYGEMCYNGNRLTSIGGRVNADNVSSYGPEQFLLKTAVKGKYRIYVDYFDDRQFTPSGPSTIMAEIFTKYADETEQKKVVCFQMSKAMAANIKFGGRDDNYYGNKEHKMVEVAEFEFY
ncbi:MAG: DUF2135 domain-containing protein [Chitinispirillales bacterium]|nr:DUF2135 domain-containing protein [Chitinispirillales bacterium]